MPMVAKSPEFYAKRFWTLLNSSPDGCWLWSGFKNANGYGKYYAGQGRDKVYAHRYAY